VEEHTLQSADVKEEEIPMSRFVQCTMSNWGIFNILVTTGYVMHQQV